MSESDNLDIQLLADMARGRIEALGEFVRRHQDAAMGLALRILRRSDLAEDVVQEAFLRVHRSAGRFRPEAKVSTWLYQIVLNLCRDRLRRVGRDRPGLPGDLPASAADDPAGVLQAEETAGLVRRAVHALPQRQKTVVILHRFQQLSHSEIAQVTGWSVSAVESLLVRAYQHLRVELADLAEPDE